MAKQCQSCGMPMHKDPKGGGSEKDGSLSRTYCSLCYADGAFVHQTNDVSEFQAHCVQALMKKGTPKLMAWAFTRGIPKLERWRDNAA